MRALILVSIFLVGCSPGETDAGEDDSDRTIRPVLAGRLENRDIDEASGIARSQNAAGVYWVINDSGKPRPHPIDERGRALGRVKIDDSNAMVLAGCAAPGGTLGANLLTSCLGVTNSGIVNPADLDLTDDAGVCSPVAPPALYMSAADFGVHWY